jgi:hypothetical protein
MDEKNVTVHDSYNTISKRGKPSKKHPLGKPKWKSGAGAYVVSWNEFDRAWNTIDNYVTVPDSDWDEGGTIPGKVEDKLWRRFWCVIGQPQQQL